MLRIARDNQNKYTAGELEKTKRILKAKIKSKVKSMRASSEAIPPYKFVHSASQPASVISTPSIPLPSPAETVVIKEPRQKRKLGQQKMEL